MISDARKILLGIVTNFCPCRNNFFLAALIFSCNKKFLLTAKKNLVPRKKKRRCHYTEIFFSWHQKAFLYAPSHRLIYEL